MSAFPETADVETSSDDYARRFAGPVGEWFLERQATTPGNLATQGFGLVALGSKCLAGEFINLLPHAPLSPNGAVAFMRGLNSLPRGADDTRHQANESNQTANHQ